MSTPSWDRVQRAFEEAETLDGPDRDAYLRALRAEDAACAAEVEALLASDAAPHPVFADSGSGHRALMDEAIADHREDTASGLRSRTEAALADRYAIVGELGRGGMSVVFEGVERKHDRRVAVKVMRPSVTGRVSRRRFGVEVQLTAQLAHPHIVPLYDSGEADGLLYYVTAAVPGETLAARVAREGALRPSAVREILKGVAAALDYAHDRRIVHRDVKPSNILLHDRLALLTDFGIGKALEGAEAPDATRTGMTLGTPRYMSPEQLRGEDVGPASDLYSLGLVTYEMLTGRPASEGKTAYAIMAERIESVLPSPSTINPRLPAAVDAVIAKALAPDAADRYASADAFRLAVEAALDGTSSGGTATRPEAVSLAVLPLDNRAPDGDDAYLSEGISEQVIHQLANVPGLRVAARASSFAAAQQSDPRAVALALNVRHLVTGSLRRQGDRLRIHAELEDVETGDVGWSETYDRRLDDVFAVQDEIVQSIADTLRDLLGRPATPLPEPTAHQIPDVDAYQYYLRARHAIFAFTEESLREALGYLDRGLEILGDNVPLLAAKGYAHWQFVNAGIDPDPAHLDETAALADRIAEIDAASHHADRLRGLAAFHQVRHADAIRYLERALAADPNDVDSAVWLALLLGFRGQPHRAEPLVTMLLERDPINPLHQFLPGFLALMRGEAELAPGPFRTALDMAPQNPVLRLGAGQAEAMAGETEAALATLRPLDEHAPGSLFAALGRLLRRGLGEDVGALTDTEAEAAALDLQWCWTAAQGYALAGDLDEGMAWLRRAVQRGLHNYPLVALHDPLLTPLRGHAAFEALVDELEPVWSAQLGPASGTTRTPLT